MRRALKFVFVAVLAWLASATIDGSLKYVSGLQKSGFANCIDHALD